MTKEEFLDKLKKGLSGLPEPDIQERLTFFGEMIDDKIEDGMDEETAIYEIGDIDEIISHIIAEFPITKLVKEKIKPKKNLSVWEITFLVLGSPIWLSLLITAFAVAFSAYVSLWVVIISLWSVFASLIGVALGSIIASIVFIAFIDNFLTGIAVFASSLVCIGLSIFVFFGCKEITKGFLWLTKKLLFTIKNLIFKKEAVQ